MSFISKLEERARSIKSLLCVGLDPNPADGDILEQCRKVIYTTADMALAYKINSAFFDVYKSGDYLLEIVSSYIPPGIPVILDMKRNDIPEVSKLYAEYAFNRIGCDAVTVQPYMGWDSIEPFIDNPERGAFVLCKTSNSGSTDLQTAQSGYCSTPVYELIAKQAALHNKNDNLGLVVGANSKFELSVVRKHAPKLWFLSPGVGAQGADVESALNCGLRKDGLGMLINVSRSILKSENPREYAEDLCLQINKCVANRVEERDKKELALLLKAFLCIRFGDFILKSGKSSKVYIDLRILGGLPHLLESVASAYINIINDLKCNAIVAIPYAAMPIGTAISLNMKVPMFYVRKEAKNYGTKSLIEGRTDNTSKQVAVVVDDVATDGTSKLEVIEKLRSENIEVTDVVVLVDREDGAREALAKEGIKLHAVFTLTELLGYA